MGHVLDTPRCVPPQTDDMCRSPLSNDQRASTRTTKETQETLGHGRGAARQDTAHGRGGPGLASEGPACGGRQRGDSSSMGRGLRHMRASS